MKDTVTFLVSVIQPMRVLERKSGRVLIKTKK